MISNNKINIFNVFSLKNCLLTILCVFLFSNTVYALTIQDYDTVAMDSYTLLDDYSMTSTFLYSGGASGSLEVNVYFDYSSKIFLYEFSIDPTGTDNISLVSALVYGDYYDGDSSGLRAGYSLSDAGSISFTTSYDEYPDNSINFTLNSGNWSSTGDTITFYFESLFAPELTELAYSITNSELKVSANYAPNPDASLPVPEPSTIMLLLTGFSCFSGIKLRNKLGTIKKN